MVDVFPIKAFSKGQAPVIAIESFDTLKKLAETYERLYIFKLNESYFFIYDGVVYICAGDQKRHRPLPNEPWSLDTSEARIHALLKNKHPRS